MQDIIAAQTGMSQTRSRRAPGTTAYNLRQQLRRQQFGQFADDPISQVVLRGLAGELRPESVRLAGPMRGSVEGLKEMRRGLRQTGREKDKLRDNFTSFGTKVKDIAKSTGLNIARFIGGALSPLITPLRLLGYGWRFALVGMGAAVGFFVKHAVDQFLQFERNITEVLVQTPGKAKASWGQFADEAFAISKELSVSVFGVTESLRLAVSVGFESMAQASEVARASSKLAIASFSDIKTATQAVTNILNSYGLQASDATHVTDVLMRGWQVAGGDMDLFAKGLGIVASSIAATGGSIEDLVGITALLSRSAAGNSRIFIETQQAVQQLVAPNAAAASAMSRLGVQFERNKKGGIAVMETLDKLHAKISKLAGRDQAKIFQLLSGVFPRERGRRAIARFFAAAPESVAEVFRAVRNAQGAVEEGLNTVNARMFRQWERLKATGQRVFVSLGMIAATALQPLVEVTEDWFGQLEMGEPLFLALADRMQIWAAAALDWFADLIDGLDRLINRMDVLIDRANRLTDPFGLDQPHGWQKRFGNWLGEDLNITPFPPRPPGPYDPESGQYGPYPSNPFAPWWLQRQHGGLVPGTGTGDRVPTMLEPGEEVLSRGDPRHIANIHHMQRGGVADSGAAEWLRQRAQSMRAPAVEREAQAARTIGPELASLRRTVEQFYQANLLQKRDYERFGRAVQRFEKASTDFGRRWHGQAAINIGKQITSKEGVKQPEATSDEKAAQDILWKYNGMSVAAKQRMKPTEQKEVRDAQQFMRRVRPGFTPGVTPHRDRRRGMAKARREEEQRIRDLPPEWRKIQQQALQAGAGPAGMVGGLFGIGAAAAGTLGMGGASASLNLPAPKGPGFTAAQAYGFTKDQRAGIDDVLGTGGVVKPQPLGKFRGKRLGGQDVPPKREPGIYGPGAGAFAARRMLVNWVDRVPSVGGESDRDELIKMLQQVDSPDENAELLRPLRELSMPERIKMLDEVRARAPVVSGGARINGKILNRPEPGRPGISWADEPGAEAGVAPVIAPPVGKLRYKYVPGAGDPFPLPPITGPTGVRSQGWWNPDASGRMIQPPPGHMGKSPQEIIDATQDELARQRQSSKQQDRLKRARELDEVDRRWRERDEQYQLNRPIQRFEEDRPGLLEGQPGLLEGQDAAPRVIELLETIAEAVSSSSAEKPDDSTAKNTDKIVTQNTEQTRTLRDMLKELQEQQFDVIDFI